MITKIKSVQGSGHFDGQYGRLYKFEYTFEDGVTLVANHKTQDCPYKQGDVVEYTITKEDPKYGKSGKVGIPKEEPTYQPEDNDKRQRMIVYQNAFTQANSYHGVVGYKDGSAEIQQLCNTADYIFNHIMKRSQ